MRDINSVFLQGRATKEAELRYTKSGTPALSFSLASNYGVKDPEGNWTEAANFFECTYYGKGAEVVASKIGKGTALVIQGELRQERWDQDGQPRSKVKIIVYELRITDFHKDKPEAAATHAAPYKPGNPPPFEGRVPGPRAATEPPVPAKDMFDDDIPF